MSFKTKILLFLVLLVLAFLGTTFVVYRISSKAAAKPASELPAETVNSYESQKGKISRFNLGDFMATARDQGLHYIKIQIEVAYVGDLESVLEEHKAELHDKVTNHLMKLTIQRAKEDYIDGFLHKDLERELNKILGTSASESRIVRVVIPSFLVN